MKLQFTGTISPWLLGLLFLSAAGLSVWLYRRHRLQKPWSFWLPAARVTAIALLILSLFQPVLTRFRAAAARSRIPVIVDTSGSMSMVDHYPTNRQVEIAWRMGMFPSRLRNGEFAAQAGSWAAVAASADALKGDAERLNAVILKQEPWTRVFADGIDAFAQGLKNLADSAAGFRRKLENSTKDTGYLAGNEKDMSARSRFAEALQTWKAAVEGMEKELSSIVETLRAANKAEAKDPRTATGALDRTLKAFAAIPLARTGLPLLQQRADECLVAAAIPEVDQALRKLAAMKRADLARSVLFDEPVRLVNRLSEKGDVSVFSFKEVPDPVRPADYARLVGELSATKIGSVLWNVLRRYGADPVAGVILLTDGNNNAGKSVAMVQDAIQERGIPLYVLGVGAPEPPRDVAIAQVIAPHTSFADDRLNINVILLRHQHLDRKILLKVLSGPDVLQEKLIEPGPDARLVVDLSFVEKKGGLRHYTVEAEKFDGEAFAQNNSQSFSVNVLEDRIRVLLADEFPRWESRYVNMMLQRDKRVDIRAIFIASTKDQTLPSGKDGFPEKQDELFAYSVVILGDVNPRHFSTGQMEALRAFVTERGGALIALAGERFMPTRYAGTPIEALIPLKKFGQDDQSGGAAHAPANAPPGRSGRRLEVARYALYDDILQIGGTPEQSRDLWENLPGPDWIKKGAQASPAADLIVYAADERAPDAGVSVEAEPRPAEEFDAPVMVKSYVGLGKVLYIGADEFWRWRYRARWTYHHRFWGQILLWATMGRTSGADRYVKLMSDRPAYAPEEAITVYARILNDDAAPISGADAALEVFDEKNTLLKNVPLAHMEKSGGEYRAQIRDLPRGRYRITPRVQELKDKKVEAKLDLEVCDLPTSEYVDLALNESLLRRLATRYVAFDQASSILDDMRPVTLKEERHDDTELWDTFPFMALVAALLAFEWQMRKKLKMV
ncbi:MAG: hypothetical protein QME60_03000 [Verrucomicrobiota bacterium]|nr:hypothetical protein [Verrucomicrobiota bacterium]